MPINITDPLLQSIVAERAERYEDMVECANALVTRGGDLTLQERGIFSEAYRRCVGKYRTAWRLLGQVEQRKAGQPNAETEVREYRRQFANKISGMCNEGLKLLEEVAKKAHRDDQHVWCAKQNADFHRYIAEVDRSKMSDAVRASLTAEEVARRLPSGDALRLVTFLNRAIFVHEVQGDAERAINILDNALRECPEPEVPREQKVVRALMAHNLEAWRARASAY